MVAVRPRYLVGLPVILPKKLSECLRILPRPQRPPARPPTGMPWAGAVGIGRGGVTGWTVVTVPPIPDPGSTGDGVADGCGAGYGRDVGGAGVVAGGRVGAGVMGPSTVLRVLQMSAITEPRSGGVMLRTTLPRSEPDVQDMPARSPRSSTDAPSLPSPRGPRGELRCGGTRCWGALVFDGPSRSVTHGAQSAPYGCRA